MTTGTNDTRSAGVPACGPLPRVRPLYCSCRGEHAEPIHECKIHGTFQIDITQANNLITEWGRIAISIARQCKWRPQGQCRIDCQGIAVCNLDGLTLVNAQGQPVGATRRVALSQNLKPKT